MPPYICSKGGGFLAAANILKQIAEPLRPGDRRSPSGSSQFVGVDLISEFGKNRPHLIQPTGTILVTNEVQRRRFWRGDRDRPTRGIETLHRDFRSAFAHQERNPYGAAFDRSPTLRKKHLKFLGAVMCSAVILGGRKKASIIRKT